MINWTVAFYSDNNLSRREREVNGHRYYVAIKETVAQSVKASYAQAVWSPPSPLTEAFFALPRFVSGKDRNRMRKTPKESSMQEDKKIKPITAHLSEHASEEKGSECKSS